ncbi:hypothetical protein CAEBREN_00052 [Caenorhabditis brenneri]|uniref:Uncharacterized protein n=1 Tax=Caenorhabditis brenneri TaxID=135651 RepID=G0NGJ2_CAEBE|nr:hypothetical protein CAEBREN_00052 [Caenorhabditis brenneri]
MEYYHNGNDLIIGNRSGAVEVFDNSLHNEDNAKRWERYVKRPISKVGVINKRNVYTISDRSDATVFLDAKGKLEVLYGAVNETVDRPVTKNSKAHFKKPEWCVGLIKGVNDQLPLVAVHGVENEKYLSLTAMDAEGAREPELLLTYKGHTGEVKCMTVTPELLLTGGEDGKAIVQIANFNDPKFGADKVSY